MPPEPSRPATVRRIPLWLKLAYSGFLAVMIPVYWVNYGPTNFLYFCDVALLLTFAGIWREDALLISLPAVGILLPQVLWCVDFLVQLCGGKMTGMTSYMFDADHSLFLRGLSLFHGWLPFLLLYLVRKTGYDRRALLGWTLLCIGLCLVAYFLLPPAGAVLADPKMPRDVNYVFGMDETKPQTWLPPLAYLGVWIAALTGIVFVPTHFLLKKICPPAVKPSYQSRDVQAELSPAWPKGFWNLMFTQFQGAFSDNALRWLVIFPVLDSITLSDADKNGFASHASLLFAVPFLLFSTVGGWMADRFSKRSVMIGVKLGEIAIMLFAALAFAWEKQALQLAAICMMGVHSTFFAPAKYGIMPEVLPTSQLAAGNGILELLTFIGIILGTFAGGWLAEALLHREAWSGAILAALASLGCFVSLGIFRVPAADPARKLNYNILGEIWSNLRVMKADRDLWRANWGNTAFFFVATLVQINLALYAQKVFHLKPTEQAWLQAALSLGIGVGSLLAGRLSRGRIEYGLIAPGAGLMALAGLGLGWPGLAKSEFTAALSLLGLGGGLFIVPIVSVLQHRPSAQTKGAVQGAASWLSWVGIAAAAITQTLLSGAAHLSYNQVFWVCGAVAAAAGTFVTWSRPRAVPQMLARWGGGGVR